MLRGDRLHIHNAAKYSSDIQCKKDISMHWTKDISLHSASCWWKQITLASCMTGVDDCGLGFVVLYLSSFGITRLLVHLFMNQSMPISHSFKSQRPGFSRRVAHAAPLLDKMEVGKFLFLIFRRVLNVICSFLGNSPASEFSLPTFRNSLSVPSS